MSGYNTLFLSDAHLKAPEVSSIETNLDPYHVHHLHYSILFSAARMLPICTAVNIDGENFVEVPAGATPWKPDPFLPEDRQIGAEFYSMTETKFHKGHIVRRIDPCWGPEAADAALGTFFYSNACPQHHLFNPRIWLELERSILEKGAVAYGGKLSVFAGPILSDNDKPYIKKIKGGLIFIPSRFWKIVCWVGSNGQISAVGFIQSQEPYIGRLVDHSYGMEVKFRSAKEMDKHFQHLNFKNGKVYQVPIHQLLQEVGLEFSTENLYLPKVPEQGQLISSSIKMRGKAALRDSSTSSINLTGLRLD